MRGYQQEADKVDITPAIGEILDDMIDEVIHSQDEQPSIPSVVLDTITDIIQQIPADDDTAEG